MKNEETERIKKVQNGKKDEFGNEIENVLALGNEYVIYEIKTDELNNKLRFLIDGISEEREKNIVDAYTHVKQKYIIAKGLLYRSENFGLMKNRVAHTLATALSGRPEIAFEQFEDLIKEINREHTSNVKKRLLFSLPFYLSTFIFIIMMGIILLWCPTAKTTPFWEWNLYLICAAIGGLLAMTFTVRNMRFETEISEMIYFMHGLERVTLALLCGIVCVMAIKAKFLFGNISDGPDKIWAISFFCVIAGFSEKFIPGLLEKFENKKIKTSA